jgi:hypothetical protein
VPRFIKDKEGSMVNISAGSSTRVESILRRDVVEGRNCNFLLFTYAVNL